MSVQGYAALGSQAAGCDEICVNRFRQGGKARSQIEKRSRCSGSS
jgi:hypothetical protein